MPTSAPKPCTQCRVLVHDGSSRCMAHKVKAGSFADARRGSRHDRGYGAKWVKKRDQVLQRDAGLCQPCLGQGHTTPNCNTVDHIVNKAEWKRLHGTLAGVDADTNLQSICTACHQAKTQTEAQQAQGRGGEKSPAPSLGTDLQVKFSRAGVVGEGGTPMGKEGGAQ